MIRGLSLTPPWPWVILHAGKRIENRERWSGCDYRGPIALHASGLPSGVNTWWKRAQLEQSYSPRESQRDKIDDFVALFRDIRRIASANGVAFSDAPVTLRDLCSMTGHIVGTAMLVGVVRKDGVVVIGRGASRTERALTDAERSWWFGGFALVLDDVRPLTWIPCKGALGLWKVPEDLLPALRAAYKRTT